MQPYSSEFEGYMGNYGNTMDRWYHRAAVVEWPRERAFVVRSEVSPDWAVQRSWARVRAGDIGTARDRAATLAPFWADVAGGQHPRGFAGRVLRVATGLDHPELAAMLLRPFSVEIATAGHAKALVALVDRYGTQWAIALLAGWSSGRRGWPQPAGGGRHVWTASLAKLCGALRDTDPAAGATIGRLVLDDTWAWLHGEIVATDSLLPPSRRAAAISDMEPSIAGLLGGVAVIGADELRDTAVRALTRDDDELLTGVVEVLRGRPRAAAAAWLAAAWIRCALTTLRATGSDPARSARCAPTTTGRSLCRTDAAATCAPNSAPSSPTRDNADWSGRSLKTGGLTCTTGSTPTNSPSTTRQGARGGRTHWC